MFALLFAVVAPAFQDDLTPGEFEKLRQLCRPPKNAAWESIPWMSDLWEARRAAEKQKKPILMWSMDGHPLGCT